MAWVKLDDQFFANPKVIDLPKDAKLLYLGGLTHAAAHLTNGVLTPGAVRMICAMVDVDRAQADALIAAGLWDHDGANYIIHDYLSYNRTAEQVKADRDRNAQRQERYRERHADDSNAVTDTVTTQDVTPSLTTPRTHTPSVTPVPTPMPDPKPKTQEVPRVAAREPDANQAYTTFVEGCAVLGIDSADIVGKARTKQIGAIKAALEDSWPDDVIGCLTWLVSDTWRRDRGVDFVTVKDNIGKWILAGRPAAIAPRGSPNGKRSNEPDFSGIEEFSAIMDRRHAG